MSRAERGARGEELAAAYLKAQGFAIIGKNVRPKPCLARGDIDLLARDGEVLVFVEVKARRNPQGPHGTPAEAVDFRKQRQIARLALAYLTVNELDDVSCRFDVVEVVRQPGRAPVFTHLRDAFDATDCE